MRIFLYVLTFIILSACEPLRHIDTSSQTTADSTSVDARRDLTTVIIRDTIYRHDVVHVTVIDTTYTREHIVTRYDRETGQPIERTEERTIQSTRILDSLSLRIAYLEHAIDSLRAIDAWHLAHQSSDSISNVITTERGDSALTFWQTVWHSLRAHLIISAIVILLMLVIYFAMRPYIQKFKS